MDRLEFIEQLVQTKKELEQELTDLKKECEELYKYTIDYVKEILNDDDDDSLTAAGGVVTFGYMKQSELTIDGDEVLTTKSTKKIIDLSAEIKDLQTKIDEEKDKIDIYKRRDIRKYFPFLGGDEKEK